VTSFLKGFASGSLDFSRDDSEPLRRRAAFVRTAEFNPLRQRQLRRKIDRVRLTAHIHLPRIAPAFASAASFFFTAKGSANFRTAGAGVDIGFRIRQAWRHVATAGILFTVKAPAPVKNFAALIL